MLNPLLLFISLFGYSASLFLLVKLIVREQSISKPDQGSDRKLNSIFAVAVISMSSHFAYALLIGVSEGSINFSLSSMTVIVSAMLVFMYLLACLAMPIQRLGILVFPLTVLSLIFSFLWSSETNFLDISGAFALHVFVSLFAYSLLAIASIQALIYVYQEKQLKSKNKTLVLSALPPLETMELLLFRLVLVGFAFLSLALITGALFSQQVFGQPFEFKHHTVLAVMGWTVFAALIIKRFRQGLRGSQAVFWIISGFLLIQLGYFGTKVVSESLSIS